MGSVVAVVAEVDRVRMVDRVVVEDVRKPTAPRARADPKAICDCGVRSGVRCTPDAPHGQDSLNSERRFQTVLPPTRGVHFKVTLDLLDGGDC